MYDFTKYDDAKEIHRYDGFIDKNGYFYKVSKIGEKILDENGRVRDSHNKWAEAYLKEKLKVENFKFNPTVSALFSLTQLSGPAEILVHCFGFTYYSHDPVYYKPIIKTPNPRIANYKVTEDQLDMLYLIMLLNKESTDIPIFMGEDEDYLGTDDVKNYRKV